VLTLIVRQSRIFARLACANKPKALSTSIKRGAANGEEFARRACSFVKQNSTLPQLCTVHLPSFLWVFLCVLAFLWIPLRVVVASCASVDF